MLFLMLWLLVGRHHSRILWSWSLPRAIIRSQLPHCFPTMRSLPRTGGSSLRYSWRASLPRRRPPGSHLVSPMLLGLSFSEHRTCESEDMIYPSPSEQGTLFTSMHGELQRMHRLLGKASQSHSNYCSVEGTSQAQCFWSQSLGSR